MGTFDDSNALLGGGEGGPQPPSLAGGTGAPMPQAVSTLFAHSTPDDACRALAGTLVHCRATLALSGDEARRLARRLSADPETGDRAVACLAAVYLEALAHSLDRVELEAAGQLSLLQSVFQTELFGPGPSVAREEPNASADRREIRKVNNHANLSQK